MEWTSGQARPVKYVDTADVFDRIPATPTATTGTVTIGGFRLTVTSPTHARLRTPVGAELVITADIT